MAAYSIQSRDCDGIVDALGGSLIEGMSEPQTKTVGDSLPGLSIVDTDICCLCKLDVPGISRYYLGAEVLGNKLVHRNFIEKI